MRRALSVVALMNWCTSASLLLSSTSSVASADTPITLEPSLLVPELDPFAPPVAKDDDGVASLTNENFDTFVRSKPMTIVAFVAPWCGFCKKLKPTFAQVAREIEDEFPTVMQLARVDCVAESALYDRFKIEGFPVVKLFHFGVFADRWQTKDLGFDALRSYARGWATSPDAVTGWLYVPTLQDLYARMEYDLEQRAYTSSVPTLLTVLDPARINSDDSRLVLESLANASLKAETKHTRFIVTTDLAAVDEFMQITPDCGLTEVRACPCVRVFVRVRQSIAVAVVGAGAVACAGTDNAHTCA
jgi:thiol-disulfide isomerase/thioredoxin